MRRFLFLALLRGPARFRRPRARTATRRATSFSFQQVFLPYEAPISGTAANELRATVAAANEGASRSASR